MYVLLMYLYRNFRLRKEYSILLMILFGVSALICAVFSFMALCDDEMSIHERLKKVGIWSVVLLTLQIVYVAVPSQDTLSTWPLGTCSVRYLKTEEPKRSSQTRWTN